MFLRQKSGIDTQVKTILVRGFICEIEKPNNKGGNEGKTPLPPKTDRETRETI